MAAAMKRMGIDVRDIPNVEEVVVRTSEKEYRFRKPQVSVMKAQGQETWTVVGMPQETPRTILAQPGGLPATNIGNPLPGIAPEVSPPSSQSEPTDEDIRTVMDAAHCDASAARNALMETDGDLAEAILKLT